MAAGDATSQERQLQGPEGLLFTGNAIRALTSDQLATIGEIANRMYGVEMRQLRSVEQELGGLALATVETNEPEPVLVTREDLHTFAEEHGLSKSLAKRTWDWFIVTAHIRPLGDNGDLQPYVVLNPTNPTIPRGSTVEALELRALYDHLYPAMNDRGHFAGSKLQDGLLVAMVNEWLQPEEPVPTESFRRRRPGRA